jgi:hypothetical protein
MGSMQSIPMVRGHIKVFWIRMAQKLDSERSTCLGEPQYTSALKKCFPKAQRSRLRQLRLMNDGDPVAQTRSWNGVRGLPCKARG